MSHYQDSSPWNCHVVCLVLGMACLSWSALFAADVPVIGATLNERANIAYPATSRFIHAHEDVLLLGPPGTGKSHLAQALGHAALVQGNRSLLPSGVRAVRGDFRRRRTA